MWIRKNYKLAIVILALIIMSVILLRTKIDNVRLKNNYQLKSVELSTYKDSTSVYKSKAGDLTFKIKAVEIESNNRRKALEIAGFENKELKARNIDLRKVNFALNAKLEASGTGTVELRDSLIFNTDTIIAKVGNWSNGFLSLYPEIVDDKLTFDYTYKVELKVITETNKTISFALTDPNAKITTSNGVIIKKKSRIWNKWYTHVGVGLIGGYFLFK